MGVLGTGRRLQSPSGAQDLKAWLEKAGLCPGRRLTNLGPGYRPENTAIPLWTHCSPVLLWPCHEQHLPRDWGGAAHTHALGNRPADLGLSCGPWNCLWPSSSLSQSWFRSSPACAGMHQETPVCAPRGRSSDLSPASDPEAALWLVSSPSQPQSGSSPAHPGSIWERHPSMPLGADLQTLASTMDLKAALWLNRPSRSYTQTHTW